MRSVQESGFTIIELMMVVVILGIIAAIAIPSFTKSGRKAKSSEVPALFGEFKAREETYQAEFGRYLGMCKAAMPAAPPDQGCVEGDYWPDPLDTKSQMAVTAPPARWSALRINAGKGTVYCQYSVVAGPGGNNGNMGPTGQMLFADLPGSNPPKNWFYMMAQCDWDNDMSVNAQYWMRGDLTVLGDNGNTLR